LARIPSPDPDHIDGLHRHPSHSSNHSHSHYSHSHYSSVPSLPPLSFDSSVTLDSPTESTPDRDNNPLQPHPPTGKSLFSHSNSSAPALSTVASTPNAHPTLTHRSATAPAKRLAFASNLSVYDTFSASMYDRRSEPATWSRLTPALAQRIKEELNSYKMEEMEVHAASRIQCVNLKHEFPCSTLTCASSVVRNFSFNSRSTLVFSIFPLFHHVAAIVFTITLLPIISCSPHPVT
jgi:hypothetical protein